MCSILGILGFIHLGIFVSWPWYEFPVDGASGSSHALGRLHGLTGGVSPKAIPARAQRSKWEEGPRGAMFLT